MKLSLTVSRLCFCIVAFFVQIYRTMGMRKNQTSVRATKKHLTFVECFFTCFVLMYAYNKVVEYYYPHFTEEED